VQKALECGVKGKKLKPFRYGMTGFVYGKLEEA